VSGNDEGQFVASGVFVGLSTIDLIYSVDEFPCANAKAVARRQAVLAGGPATNAAIAFSHLGADATLVSAAGRHALVALLKDELRLYAVDHIDLTPEWDEMPAVSSVWVNGRGERCVVSVNASQINIPTAQVDRSRLEKVRILMVDGHAMSACQAWAEAARSHGVPVVFDGGSWKPGTEELLRSIGTAICSADFRPPNCTDETSIIEYLRAAGVQRIAITHGAEPIRFVTESFGGFVDVARVEAVGKSGSGDILHGAFCYFASVGYDFVDALSEASKVAAESCRFHGTREWMQTKPASQK
jgi:sugar/nucleoside kinase (ribokinase family)